MNGRERGKERGRENAYQNVKAYKVQLGGVKEREVRGGKKEDGEKWNSAEKRKLFEARQDEKKRANKTVV